MLSMQVNATYAQEDGQMLCRDLLCRDPTATSVGSEYARPLGYGVALPERLADGEFNVYRRV